MALKKFNPTSAGRRFMTVLTFDEITKTEPEKSLTEPIKRTGGRDSRGRITVRFMGGGHKRRYRVVDFRRDKPGIPAKVAAVEYDPNRTARLALLPRFIRHTPTAAPIVSRTPRLPPRHKRRSPRRSKSPTPCGNG